MGEVEEEEEAEEKDWRLQVAILCVPLSGS